MSVGLPDGDGRTRIRRRNESRILAAALEVFAESGFQAATVDRIAEAAGMSKTNLLYYFPSKTEVYSAVLNQTLDDWLEPLRAMDVNGEPIEEIRAYIRRKLELSRSNPAASRLFANEVLHGAPAIGPVLGGSLRDLVYEKAGVIRTWIDQGRIRAIDPVHLIFAIWATTQHYADFSVQVAAVLGPETDEDERFAQAEATLDMLFSGALAPR